MHQLKRKVLLVLQERINRKNRRRLLSTNVGLRTIIANNCIGGLISHYLHLQFASPTVNLFILPSDFVKMLQNFDKYFDPNATITQAQTDKDYPVADIYGCKIYFMHYSDFESAVKKWRDRCSRINKNALYIMMTDRDGCTEENMQDFDALPYQNKVLFTCREYPSIKSTFCISGFEGETVGQLQETMSITGKRYIDQFDYVEFLNRGL